jgi:ubiquinone/menaquinone biosynthesis C-methylase UbiE
MWQSNRMISKDKIDQLDLETRVSVEAQITDARAMSLDFRRLASLDTRLTTYAAHSAWRRYLFDWLGPVREKVVLDIACGYSMTPVMFALAGAEVYAVDVAPQTVATVQRFAKTKGVADRVHLHVGPIETLPFGPAQFDLIYGGAALHHLQLDRAGAELARVLKHGGKGAFQDPLGHNQLFEFARDHLSYKGKHPKKGTDHPLRVHEIVAFGRHFSTCTYRGFELASVAAKPLHLKRGSRLRQLLEAIDELILHRVPYLQRYARYVVTTVTK